MTININTLSEAIECCKCPIQWRWYIHSCISVYLNTIKFFVPVCWSAWLCGSNTIVKYSWRSWRHLGATGNVATRNGWMGFSVLVAVKDTITQRGCVCVWLLIPRNRELTCRHHFALLACAISALASWSMYAWVMCRLALANETKPCCVRTRIAALGQNFAGPVLLTCINFHPSM